MKAILSFLSLLLITSSYAQIGAKIEHYEGSSSGYFFNFEHTETSNLLCKGLFNIYSRQGTLVTLEQQALSFNFEKNSILNPSVANKFIGPACDVNYKDIDISKNPIIEIEISASQDCRVGFLVAGNVKDQFTYADGLGYKLQQLKGGEKKILRFDVPEKSWRGKVIDFTHIIGWGVQVKGPNGEPLPTLGEGRKINLFAVSFGESLSEARSKVPVAVSAEKISLTEELTSSTPSTIRTEEEGDLPVKLITPQPEADPEKEINYQDAQFTQNYKTSVNISIDSTSDHVVTTFIEPGTKTITLKSKNNAPIRIYNGYGEVKNVSVFNNTVDLQDLPEGTYILKQGTSSTRFVKQ